MLRSIESNFSLTNAYAYEERFNAIVEAVGRGDGDGALRLYMEALRIMEREGTAYGAGNEYVYEDGEELGLEGVSGRKN